MVFAPAGVAAGRVQHVVVDFNAPAREKFATEYVPALMHSFPVSGHKWAIKEFKPDLPFGWSSYRLLVTDVGLSNPRRFLLWLYTTDGMRAMRVHQFGGGASNRFATVATIVSMLTDAVSKNGNLMLNVPLRGDGSVDEHEEAFLAGLTAWMDVNSEGICSTRPWKICGEGPSTTAQPVRGYGRTSPPYTPEDICFATKAGALYAFAGAWPESRIARIKSLAAGWPQLSGAKVTPVSLLGYGGQVAWKRDEQGLWVSFPEQPPGQHAVTLKLHGLPTA
jgi:hypothetical protein